MPAPWFGTAPEALLQGLASCPDAEVHVVSCIRQRIPSPEKLAPNIFFHSLVVPKAGWMSTLFLGCVLATRKKLEGNLGPDIVHGQGTEGVLLAGAAKAFTNAWCAPADPRYVRLIAKVERRRPFSSQVRRAWLSRAWRFRARRVWTLHWRAPARRCRACRSGTWVVLSAVDSSFFDVDAHPPVETPPRILCVGRVCERKNQNARSSAHWKCSPLASNGSNPYFWARSRLGRPYDDEFLALVSVPERESCMTKANRERLKAFFQECKLAGIAFPGGQLPDGGVGVPWRVVGFRSWCESGRRAGFI